MREGLGSAVTVPLPNKQIDLLFNMPPLHCTRLEPCLLRSIDSKSVTLVILIPSIACTLTCFVIIFGGEGRATNGRRQRPPVRSQDQCNSGILHIYEWFIE